MAQQNKSTAPPTIRREVFAVLGIFISVFLFLSLLSNSISPGDNWCGKVGHLTASVLVNFLGHGSYLLPLLLMLSAILVLGAQLSFVRLPQIMAGLSGSLISFCGLLSSFSLHSKELLDAGGFLGRTTFVILNRVSGNVGSVLILVMVLLVSLMLATSFSPFRTLAFISKAIAGATKRIFQRSTVDETTRKHRKPKVRRLEERVVEEEKPVPAGRPVVKELKSHGKSEKEESFSAAPIARGDWKLPPITLLSKPGKVAKPVDREIYYKLSKQLEQKLKNFGVSGNVVGICPGPVVTTYEYSPAPGVKINKIAGLADDIALGLKAPSVRVVGSVPGKAALGIEIPNSVRQIVYIRELIGTEEYRSTSQKLAMVLGLDVVGNLAMANLAKMPHLLIAGATGAGKSVGINTIIASILFNATPEEVRFLMVDPKRIELSGYEGIPHLLHPVVVDPKLASRALNWAVQEMERRYRLLEEAKVKSFDSYNEVSEEKLPYIVIIVDELADLMMVASKDIESSIARLAQMARAAGMHMILATQRPSVDVLTGLIKANFPTRISFKVSSKIDSRTILDSSGAEHLLGAGDMLYLAPGSSGLQRIHGAYISEKETAGVVEFWKEQGVTRYDESVVKEIEKGASQEEGTGDEEYDEKYDEAVAMVTAAGQASISMIQRRLRIGYNRAARIIETMEKDGVVGPADGARPRQVIVRGDYA